MQQLFVDLCEIPSPTGSERAVADRLAAELRGMGLDVTEDDSAEAARAECGNLVARTRGTGPGWVMFCAHMDTVPHSEPIRVVNDDGVFRSAGETILGADNKAAVAVMVELMARAVEDPPEAGIELVLTVAEEDGLRGAHAFDLERLESKMGYVLDHATPIGEFATAAPTYKKLIADFQGVEAHAGIRPEEGQSAISAAASAIATMELGRIDEETTANIGMVEGGTAANVVAGHCRIEGEARCVDPQRAVEISHRMLDACTMAAGDHGCDVEVEISEMFRGYRIDSRSAAMKLAKQALSDCGIDPVPITTGGGSDANAFRAAGFDCLLLANGTTDNHTADESVSVADLELMLEVCSRIVELAPASEAVG